MRQSNRARRYQSASEPTGAREALERRWHDTLAPEPRLATLVTAQGNSREPFHRWMPYRQGFSPGLVRLFLEETSASRLKKPILDPFSGSGTTIVECARQGRAALGAEALASLVFISAAKFEQQWVDLPPLNEAAPLEAIAAKLERPLHRAALLIAHARRHTGSGALNRNAPTLTKALRGIVQVMQEDLSHPLPLRNQIFCDDARFLRHIEAQSCGGVLTSPPYLSRYDYAESNDPLQRMYRRWFPEAPRPEGKQIHAAPDPRKNRTRDSGALHEAAREAQEALTSYSQRAPAEAMGGYFRDMHLVLQCMHRVLVPGAPAWLIVGGVRLKEVYVPTDLIIAEMAESAGFEVEALRVARDLNPIRRKFGAAGFVAPRETLTVLRRQ